MTDRKEPLVAVLPTRLEPGIDRHSELESKKPNRPRTYRARPLSDVIATRYSTYAHLLLYHVPGEENWPRINKPALEEARELGASPMVELTALDMDNPDHKRWKNRSGYLKLLKKVRRLHRQAGLILPTYVWRTRAGARFLFQHPAVTPEQAEALHEWLREHYTSHGFDMDTKVWEWARPHALPWVVRDEQALDPTPVLQFPPLRKLPELPERRVTRALDADVLRAGQPDPHDAALLVWKENSDKLTEFGQWAKKRLAGADCEVCFDPNNVPELEEGLRNPTFFRWAGAITKSIYGKKHSTPEHVFAILCPTIEANAVEGRDIYNEVWRGVSYCWAKEINKAEEEQEDRATFLDQLKAGVSQWSPEVPEGEEEFGQWIRTRLVMAHGTDYYLLRPDGRYDPSPTKHANLVASLRASGMAGAGKVLPDLVNKDGVAVKCQDIVDRFSSPVSSVLIEGGAKLGGIVQTTPEGPQLVLTTFARRTDITPAPSDWATGWLKAMFGEHLPLAEEWISCALNFEGGPCAAMSIEGKRGIGKDLVLWILARTTTSRTFSTARQAVGQFTPKLHRTPWVWFNEGCPSGRDLHMSFRELVGGHLLESNQKHRQQQDVAMCARVYISANRPVVLQRLFSDPNMTDSELEATAERLIHIRLGSGGRKWIKENGGKDVAKEKLESDELSKHFLWLWETVPRSRHSGRFQISGDPNDPYLRSLGFGSVAVVGEILVRMVEVGKLNNVSKLKAGKVLDFADNLLLTSRGKELNLVTLGRSLAQFRRQDGTADMKKLWEFSRASGMDAPVLRSILVKLKKQET